MKLTKKIISIFLSVLIMLSVISTSISVFAAEYTENKARAEYFDSALSGYLKNIVDTDDAVKLAEKEKVEEAVSEVKAASASKARSFSPARNAPEKDSSNAVKEAISDLNMVIVLVGQFIKNIGGLPCAYVFMALFADVLDHIEWKCGFRCDGVSMSVYNIIAVSSIGICTGIFNMMLAKTGYIAPELNAAGELIAVQPEPVKKAITFAFVGLEAITGVILAVLLIFLNVEKGLKKKQDEIKVRKGLAVETDVN